MTQVIANNIQLVTPHAGGALFCVTHESVWLETNFTIQDFHKTSADLPFLRSDCLLQLDARVQFQEDDAQAPQVDGGSAPTVTL